MLPVLTAAEMREADRRTIEEIGLPGAVLMENAGAGVARWLKARYPQAARVAILCGRGNNGGDGFVVARRLGSAETYLVGARADVKGDAALHLGALLRSGGVVTELANEASWERHRDRVLGADVIVDALLGTGLNRAPEGLVDTLIRDLARVGPARVVAVDLPSGVPSDEADVPWETVRAALTVTFAARKRGHVLPPACDRVGEVVVVDIGVPEAVLQDVGTCLFLLESADAGRAFPPPRPGAHKGDLGHLLVVAGSVGKTGAAVLAGTAGLLGGAGLVTVATPAPALPMVAAGRPELMTEPLPVAEDGGLDEKALERALALAGSRTAAVLGPGLGQSASTRRFVEGFVESCPVPLLVDADGLNLLSPMGPDRASCLATRPAATVLTPHPGEMARLVGTSTREVLSRRLEVVRELSARCRSVVLLKGQATLIAEPDGRAAVNPTGNPGMATGGTGDVLAGLIGALLACGQDPFSAAAAGVYVHGLAGDRARDGRGTHSLVAGDLLAELPGAVLSVGGDEGRG